jgi:hypothetical protein
MAFLTIGPASLVLPVRRDAAEEAEDGMGKRRWTFTLASLPNGTYDAVRGMIGTPSGAESERAYDGTLLTDRPLVQIGGDFFLETGVASAEVTLTAARFRHARVAGEPYFRRTMTLVLREP